MDVEQVTRFTKFWTQAQRAVLAFISSTVTNFADAEDVLQKVSTVAVLKFEDFSPDGELAEFTTWTFSIARYEVLTYLRSRSSDRHQFSSEVVGDLAEAFESVAAEYDDRRIALGHCISGLSDRPKEVLQKRYGEGMKTGVIARLMGLSAGNVSVILNRTYQQLRKCVDARLESPEAAT